MSGHKEAHPTVKAVGVQSNELPKTPADRVREVRPLHSTVSCPARGSRGWSEGSCLAPGSHCCSEGSCPAPGSRGCSEGSCPAPGSHGCSEGSCPAPGSCGCSEGAVTEANKAREATYSCNPVMRTVCYEVPVRSSIVLDLLAYADSTSSRELRTAC